MSESIKLYGDAFKRKPLEKVVAGDFYVEHTVYKVLHQAPRENGKVHFDIRTMQNNCYNYDENTIKDLATPLSTYTSVEKVTKTVLFELFCNLSVNDIWFATFLKQEQEKNWQKELVEKIQSMEKNDAVKFVKKDFSTLGKVKRELAGQKIMLKSSNNYYMVRDLNIYFDELNTSRSIDQAAKSSIRNLDVNTLQSLIFNNVKYELK